MHADKCSPRPRAGFTLIELMVVISLLLVMFGLGLLMWPGFQEKQRVAQGASEVQGWLMIARSRAIRDKMPRGVRLVRDPSNLNIITELQYIEQPDDFSGGTVSTQSDNATQVDFSFDLRDPNAVNDLTRVAIQAGDFIEFNGGGLMRQITGIDMTTGRAATLAPVATGSPIHYQVQPTANYRIVRAPRLTGEDSLRMPADIAIDLTPGAGKKTEFDPPSDILFAPSGAVIGAGAANNRIVFWIRDVTLPNVTDGEPTLVVIYTRSGAIAAHPVDVQNAANHYSFTEDGRSSGN